MISTVTYNGDGVTRIFPVAFEIKGEEYTVVYVGGIAVADRSLYDIINNSIVFNTAPVIGTNNVEIVVASTTTEIADLNAPPSTIQTVLDNMTDINAIADTVIPNIDEILLADDNASIATAKALEAATSAGEALASKNLAVTSAGSALVSEQNADASEALALSYKNSAEASATTATTQAGIATTKAGEASLSASQALTSRNEAEGFRDGAQGYADSINPDNIVHKTGDETIADIKTFSSFPITPSSAPTTDYQIANKKYVDDNGFSIASTAEAQVGTDNIKGITPLRLREGLNAIGTAPIYACRAWVNFNGTGTVAIRASGNVSSITDNGTGNYTVNFINAMQDINYCAVGQTNTPTITGIKAQTYNTGNCVFTTPAYNATLYDESICNVSIFR